MSVQLPPIPNNPVTDTFVWRDWFFKVSQLLVQQASIAWTSLDFTGSNLLDIQTRQHNALQAVQGGNSGQYYHLTAAEHATVAALPSFGTMATQNANNVNITGGSISGTTFDNLTRITTRNHNDLQSLQGGTTGEYYHLTASEHSTVVGLGVYPFIETYDRTNTIALSTTPQLLKPIAVLNQNNISYDATTGEFTFSYAGTYQLSVAVNALSTTAGQTVYIWAENNTGSGWVVNTNSGKEFALINNDPTQCSLAAPTKRVAGQKVRYWISATSSTVSIYPLTIPSTTAVVPTIRIIYSGVAN